MLRLHELVIRITTADGLVGVRLPFKKGLNIISGENTTGKSTCIEAISYCLGLDAMVTPKHAIPLPHALTDKVIVGTDERPVLASEILLEISNGKNAWTIRRSAKGDESPFLVSVWDGALLTHSSTGATRKDYFVRKPGAAQRERGFHHALSEFLGWELPLVPHFDNSESPLYVETVFPLMFVEQKRGWSTLQNRFPTQFGIKDVAKRATEFLLNLHAYERAVERQRLQVEADEIRAEWRSAVSKLTGSAVAEEAQIVDLPDKPIGVWPPEIPPRVLLKRGGEWLQADAAAAADRDFVASASSIAIPNVAAIVTEADSELAEVEREIAELQRRGASLLDHIETIEAESERLRKRLDFLDADIQRHVDARQVMNLGGAAGEHLDFATCPTCHQEVSDQVLHESPIPVMTLEDNIAQLKQEREVASIAVETQQIERANTEAELAELRSFLRDRRSRVRALRTTLASSSDAPSVAAIEERLRVETRLSRIERFTDQVDEALADFEPLASRWASVTARRAELGDAELSPEDEEKLASFEGDFVEQLRLYGETSFRPSDLSISPHTYRPTVENFDLEFVMSASDVIRMIWSYLVALLEVSRSKRTNHLGLLVLDEPKQQDTAPESFARLLERLSRSQTFGQQVIVATSEKGPQLAAMLDGLPCSVLHTGLHVLQPITE